MRQATLFGNDLFEIKGWEQLKSVSLESHDQIFLEILKKHGFDNLLIPIPLKQRYSKGRKWSYNEFEACFKAWKEKKPLTLIAGALNRNPQDIIYKLLDRCQKENLKFTQKERSLTSKNWTSSVKKCAEELFENGLPAWKIAVLFKVEFEFVEKKLFVNRKGYGHNKKNPFSINSDHKQLSNEQIVSSCDFKITSALEAYAGEGRFTNILIETEALNKIVCIERDKDVFQNLKSNVKSNKVNFINDDNTKILGTYDLGKFDLVDLDPFVTCHEQLDTVWEHLNNKGLLFLTFGGEYRRSFINTNRQSIYKRYSFLDLELSNKDYLDIIPYFFLGYVGKKATENGYTFEVLKSVRYANNCRFWLKVKKTNNTEDWCKKNIEISERGIEFKNIYIPRFKEIRKEIDIALKTGFNR